MRLKVVLTINYLSLKSALHGEVNGDVFRDVYIKPWTRIGPFLIGIFYGFAINEVQANPGLKYLFKKVSKNNNLQLNSKF
jgi:hypothetical protein